MHIWFLHTKRHQPYIAQVPGSPVPLLASYKTNPCHMKYEMHEHENQTIVGATVFHNVSTLKTSS